MLGFGEPFEAVLEGECWPTSRGGCGCLLPAFALPKSVVGWQIEGDVPKGIDCRRHVSTSL